jgi:IclR family KDG regulon transcriptional repressor
MIRTIKSAERTLGLLELFSRRQSALTVSEVTRGLSIPQPSASMLLRNLASLGYLEYDRDNRTYAPSIRVVLLGSWISRRFSEAGALSARLEELHRQLGETVFVGIQNGANAQYVQRCGEPARFNIDSGQMRSLTLSAMGRVLLSLKKDADVVRWVRRCNAEALDVRLKVRESDFLDMIAQVRSEGFAETRGDLTLGLGAIAVHIPAPIGQTPLAVGCGGAVESITAKRDAIIEALRDFQRNFPTPAQSGGSANAWPGGLAG